MRSAGKFRWITPTGPRLRWTRQRMPRWSRRREAAFLRRLRTWSSSACSVCWSIGWSGSMTGTGAIELWNVIGTIGGDTDTWTMIAGFCLFIGIISGVLLSCLIREECDARRRHKRAMERVYPGLSAHPASGADTALGHHHAGDPGERAADCDNHGQAGNDAEKY